jgi:hypothetical protein
MRVRLITGVMVKTDHWTVNTDLPVAPARS